jgi:hypothetical protein
MKLYYATQLTREDGKRLLYYLSVLLEERGVRMADVTDVFKKRMEKPVSRTSPAGWRALLLFVDEIVAGLLKRLHGIHQMLLHHEHIVGVEGADGKEGNMRFSEWFGD